MHDLYELLMLFFFYRARSHDPVLNMFSLLLSMFSRNDVTSAQKAILITEFYMLVVDVNNSYKNIPFTGGRLLLCIGLCCCYVCCYRAVAITIMPRLILRFLQAYMCINLLQMFIYMPYSYNNCVYICVIFSSYMSDTHNIYIRHI